MFLKKDPCLTASLCMLTKLSLIILQQMKEFLLQHRIKKILNLYENSFQNYSKSIR